MTATQIADALVTKLSSASVIGLASKAGYQILETSASAAAMVKWTDLIFTPSNFGEDYEEVYEFEIKCFIRAGNDANLTNNRVWDATERILQCLKTDKTINGTCDDIRRIRGANQPENIYTLDSGASWLTFTLQVQAVIL